MRLLIAGWHGQLARALVEIAPSAPDITALAVGRPGLDLCEPATITRAMTDFRPDVIINTAAYTGVDRAESEPAAAFALNRDGTRLLAEASAKRGAALIHLSTEQVFDGQKEGAYLEDDATGPISVFGQSKLEGEKAVRLANPRHIIVRTSWVHSAGGRNFVRTMLRKAREEPLIRVVDDQTGFPTYAPHLAIVILDLARRIVAKNAVPWGTYHASGGGDAVSWFGLANEIFRQSAATGGPSPLLEPIASSDYPTQAARPLNAQLDCGKLQRAFGLKLPEWQKGIAECVARLSASQH